MKPKLTILAVLVLFLPIMASAQYYTADDTCDVSLAAGLTSAAITTGSLIIDHNSGDWIHATASCMVDSIEWHSPYKKHDTLTSYITEIKEICDTLYKQKFVEAGKLKGEMMFEIVYVHDTTKCRMDTTWADKVQVYLKPDELKKLMEILN